MTALFLALGYLGVPVAFALMAGVIVGTVLTPITFQSMVGQLFNGIDSESADGDPVLPAGGRADDLGQRGHPHRHLSLRRWSAMSAAAWRRSPPCSACSSPACPAPRRPTSPCSAAPWRSRWRRRATRPPSSPALIAAASTIANLVPPSIMAVVYGAIGNVSIAGLFLAGIVPGLMIGIGLMLFCYFWGPVGFRRPRSSFGQLTSATRAAALPMMIPIILLGGIMTGWFTPTEAGVIAIGYILLVVIPFLSPQHLRDVPRDFVQAGLIYSLPLITIAAASAFGWLLAYLRGPITVAGWIGDVAGTDPHLIMFLLVLVFTIVGDFIEPIPAIIIFMPVVNQLTEQADINGVHMGIVLIITLAFGLITPPYGLSLLMASKFVGTRFSAALRSSVPIYVIFFATIAFAIFFPSVILWLPKTLFPESVGCFRAPGGAGYICP